MLVTSFASLSYPFVIPFTEVHIAARDDVAKHQAVSKNNGLYHSDGEKVSIYSC